MNFLCSINLSRVVPVVVASICVFFRGLSRTDASWAQESYQHLYSGYLRHKSLVLCSDLISRVGGDDPSKRVLDVRSEGVTLIKEFKQCFYESNL
jgi:hypothetical protein